jgi:hypothetical protein
MSCFRDLLSWCQDVGVDQEPPVARVAFLPCAGFPNDLAQMKFIIGMMSEGVNLLSVRAAYMY